MAPRARSTRARFPSEGCIEGELQRSRITGTVVPLASDTALTFLDSFQLVKGSQASDISQFRIFCGTFQDTDRAWGAKFRQIRSSQPAIACPISSGLSSCTKWRAPTTTRCWLGKLLASLLIRPVMNTPDSASIKSFGSDAVFSHAE